MYDQPLPQSIQFYMLYAAVAMATIIASCYLLLRRGNAFAPNNTPPFAYASGRQPSLPAWLWVICGICQRGPFRYHGYLTYG